MTRTSSTASCKRSASFQHTSTGTCESTSVGYSLNRFSLMVESQLSTWAAVTDVSGSWGEADMGSLLDADGVLYGHVPCQGSHRCTRTAHRVVDHPSSCPASSVRSPRARRASEWCRSAV